MADHPSNEVARGLIKFVEDNRDDPKKLAEFAKSLGVAEATLNAGVEELKSMLDEERQQPIAEPVEPPPVSAPGNVTPVTPPESYPTDAPQDPPQTEGAGVQGASVVETPKKRR